MNPALQVPLWVLMGLASGGLHLLLLRRSVERVRYADGRRARRSILRGLPLRLCLWTPALVLAARSGVLSCLALVAGSLLIRWLAWFLVEPGSLKALVSPD